MSRQGDSEFEHGYDVTELSAQDFDAFRETISGWDTDPVQVSSGPLDLTYLEVAAPGRRIGRLTTRPKIADRSVIYGNGLNLVIPLARLSHCGVSLKPGHVAILKPGREHRSILHEGFTSLEVSFERSHAETLGLGHLLEAKSKGPENDVFALPKHAVQSANSVAFALFPQLDKQQSSIDREILASMIDIRLSDVLQAVFRDTPRSGNAPQTDSLQRYDLVRAALEMIDECEPDKCLSVTQFSDRLGVTSRALQKAFECVLEVGPKRYCLARRLEQARRNLVRNGARPVNVTRAALDNGFQNVGRFAAYYRQQFGESPSQTLQRAGAKAN